MYGMRVQDLAEIVELSEFLTMDSKSQKVQGKLHRDFIFNFPLGTIDQIITPCGIACVIQRIFILDPGTSINCPNL